MQHRIASTQNYTIHLNPNGPNDVTIDLNGRIDVTTAPSIIRELLPKLNENTLGSIQINLSNVTYFDDYGALVLIQIKNLSRSLKVDFQLQHTSPQIDQVLNLVHFYDNKACMPAPIKKTPNIFVRLGDATLTHTFNIRYMISFLGSV
ncbi:MAG: STAS domain-containing protein, partial [Desulfobacteraceae bacterium]